MICLFLLLQLRIFPDGDSLVSSVAHENVNDQRNKRVEMFLDQQSVNQRILSQLKILQADSIHTKQELAWLLCNAYVPPPPNEWTDFKREQLNQQIVMLSKISPMEEMSVREKRRIQVYGIGGDAIPEIPTIAQVNIIGLFFALFFAKH